MSSFRFYWGLKSLIFNGYFLINLGQLGIEGVFRDHCDGVLRAFSKLAEECLAIEAKILALLESLLQDKTLNLSCLWVKGDFYCYFMGVLECKGP